MCWLVEITWSARCDRVWALSRGSDGRFYRYEFKRLSAVESSVNSVR